MFLTIEIVEQGAQYFILDLYSKAWSWSIIYYYSSLYLVTSFDISRLRSRATPSYDEV